MLNATGRVHVVHTRACSYVSYGFAMIMHGVRTSCELGFVLASHHSFGVTTGLFEFRDCSGWFDQFVCTGV
nr:hypothetical protein [Tanacetum cinerariifolium]